VNIGDLIAYIDGQLELELYDVNESEPDVFGMILDIDEDNLYNKTIYKVFIFEARRAYWLYEQQLKVISRTKTK